VHCRGYGTPSLSGIPLASRYGNASLSRRKSKIPRRPTLLLILTISKTSNISYDRSRVKVRTMGRHSPILMFHLKNVGIIACACIFNTRKGRLLFERPGRVSDNKGRRSVDRARLYTLTILGDEIPSKAFHYGVNCHQINLRLSSGLLFTVTATSEGLLSPLEGCLSLLGAMMIVLHSFLARYFEPWIVYIFSLPVEIPLWQSNNHLNGNNDVISILRHRLRALFPPLGVGSRVGWLHSWHNVRTTQFTPRCTRSERLKWYEMPLQRPASQTVFTVSTKSRLEAPHS